jgi:THO complex subunit 5
MAIDQLVTDPNLALAIQISGQSRDQANALVSLAENNDGSVPLSPTQKAEISKQQTLLLASIAQLRGLHRHATLAARETKAQTAEARQEVDRLHLQLQNLYYEQRHLQNEITACESYE